MRLSNRLLKLTLLLAFAVALGLSVASKDPASGRNVVEDLKVEDMPSDDGSGLVVSWKPLHRSKRIIEYRIYRGVHPDTLFFTQAVPVNPDTGVAGDRMYFYDSGYGEFIDLTSPGKLRQEKQQQPGSPLYRRVPRDMELAARLSESFSVLSVVDRSAFYKRGKKVYSADVADSTAYAGFHFKHQNLLASLKSGTTYYYSVVAVDERSRFQDPAPVVSGIPAPNAPEEAAALYGVWLDDTKELRFEWEYPTNKDNIMQYQLYMATGIDADAWEGVKNNPEQRGKYLRPIGTPGPAGVGSGGLLMPAYTIIPMPDGIPENARFVIEFANYQGSAFSALSAPRVMNSSQLPEKPTFYVEDKPNDKGDRLGIIWDHPIVFITKTTSLDRNNSRLKVNYQLNKTDTQDVKNLYFEFTKQGETKPFTTIKEFYQDMSFNIRVPKGYDYRKGFRVRITMDGKGVDRESYALEQDLLWDKGMMALMPSKELWRNGVEVSRIQNVVYRRGISSPNYLMLKRNTSFDGNLDVTIPYPSSVVRPVFGFSFVKNDSLHTYMGGERFARKLKKGESRSGYALVPPEIDFTYDEENDVRINLNIFRDEALKKIEDTQKELADLKKQVAKGDSPEPEMQAMKAQVEKLEKQVKMYRTNKNVLEALQQKSQRAWTAFIAKIREPESRHQNYMVVKTDTKGLFSVSDPDTCEAGKPNFYFPISNWFAKDKFVTLIAVLIYGALVVTFVTMAKRGKKLYIRPIAGLDEIDNAVGRATEMGRPMLYCMGHGGLADVATLASMSIITQVARKAAEYDTKMIVPCYDYIVLPIVQEIVREAHYSVGRPDTYDKNNIFYLTNSQFAYVAAVNGIMIREKMATNFFLGYFSAEALLMTETGNTVGAVQIAGTDSVTQIPFFITTCDYTLIGEELYAAGAYLNREPMLLGTLKAQDYFKIIIVFLVVVGSLLSSLQVMTLLNILPTK